MPALGPRIATTPQKEPVRPNRPAVLASAATMVIGTVQAAELLGSPHDLSVTATVGQGEVGIADRTGRVCAFCHTPNTANSRSFGSQWHTSDSTTHDDFVVYRSSTDSGGTVALGARSLVCLSCHDGTIAVDNYARPPGSGTEPWNSPGIYTFAFPKAHLDVDRSDSPAMASLRQDTSNDHPVGFTYATSAAEHPESGGGIRAEPRRTGALGPVLFAGQLECASCHNLHDHDGGGPGGLSQAGAIPFLRDSTDGSFLCLDCHNK